MTLEPSVMSAAECGYFTPILWREQPGLEGGSAREWRTLRERFAAARSGNFKALDDLFAIYLRVKDPALRQFARNLLGDAGTDRQLQAVEAYVLDAVVESDEVGQLCRSLCLWGRLTAVNAILVAYDRHAPGQAVAGLPLYLTTLLEPAFGDAWDFPVKPTVEALVSYEARVRALFEVRVAELGGPMTYVSFGAPFSVRRIAERSLELVDDRTYGNMVRPYLRQRFEASTGIDCSEFFREGAFQPLTAAAKLEEWLAGREPEKFVPGERYFFGHHIPRST